MSGERTRIMAICFALLPCQVMAAEQAIGRLFFTPEQRARMDVARQQERSIKIDTEQQDNEPPPANITLNGVITRSDGKTTVWINNREQSGQQIAPDIAVPKHGRPAAQVSVITPDTKRAIQLRVGQSLDMSSGQVEEGYRRTPPQPQPDKKETPPASTPGTPSKSLSRIGDTQEDAPEPANAQDTMSSPR